MQCAVESHSAHVASFNNRLHSPAFYLVSRGQIPSRVWLCETTFYRTYTRCDKKLGRQVATYTIDNIPMEVYYLCVYTEAGEWSLVATPICFETYRIHCQWNLASLLLHFDGMQCEMSVSDSYLNFLICSYTRCDKKLGVESGNEAMRMRNTAPRFQLLVGVSSIERACTWCLMDPLAFDAVRQVVQ